MRLRLLLLVALLSPQPPPVASGCDLPEWGGAVLELLNKKRQTVTRSSAARPAYSLGWDADLSSVAGIVASGMCHGGTPDRTLHRVAAYDDVAVLMYRCQSDCPAELPQTAADVWWNSPVAGHNRTSLQHGASYALGCALQHCEGETLVHACLVAPAAGDSEAAVTPEGTSRPQQLAVPDLRTVQRHPGLARCHEPSLSGTAAPSYSYSQETPENHVFPWTLVAVVAGLSLLCLGVWGVVLYHLAADSGYFTSSSSFSSSSSSRSRAKLNASNLEAWNRLNNKNLEAQAQPLLVNRI